MNIKDKIMERVLRPPPKSPRKRALYYWELKDDVDVYLEGEERERVLCELERAGQESRVVTLCKEIESLEVKDCSAQDLFGRRDTGFKYRKVFSVKGGGNVRYV